LDLGIGDGDVKEEEDVGAMAWLRAEDAELGEATEQRGCCELATKTLEVPSLLASRKK
jgi:hypothetical protein